MAYKISWAAPNERSRKVVKRSNARTTGKYPSWKAGRMLQWESQIERDAFYLFDADIEIRIFREQPARVEYWLDGERHRHYPDTFVAGRQWRRFVEVKSREEMKDPFVLRRAEYLSAVLAVEGLGYELLGEEEIRREPRLSNVTEMVGLGRRKIRDMDREAVRRVLENKKEITWGEVMDGDAGQCGMFLVARLILEGVMEFDYEKDWTCETIIRPRQAVAGGLYGTW